MWKGIPVGIALGIQPICNGLFTSLGSVSSVLILYFAGYNFRNWILKQYGQKRIEKKKKFGDLFVDSLLDIAVNKVFTIYQKPRSRDFIDLYFILQKDKRLSLDELAKKAQIKFGHHIDPIQLGAQYIKAKELKDFPKMLVKIDENIWQNFFIEEAKKLSGEIVE